MLFRMRALLPQRGAADLARQRSKECSRLELRELHPEAAGPVVEVLIQGGESLKEVRALADGLAKAA
jgi:hypothetical protein